MRLIKIQWKRAGRPNWALPFFAGLLSGAAVVYLNAGIFLTETGFLSRVTLERLGRTELNEGLFLFYVLQKRLGMIWLAAVLATTFAGIVTTYLLALWMGACVGVAAAVSLMRYGIKGILLLAGAMLPHYLFYIPAFLMLADWCFRMCTKLYYPVVDYTAAYNGASEKLVMLRGFLLLHAVVIIGAILESYVNPNLMSELIKIF